MYIKKVVLSFIDKLYIIRDLIRYTVHDIKYYMLFFSKYEEDQEVLFSKLRTSVHILDKGINVFPFEKNHGRKVYNRCIELRMRITDPLILSDNAFEWINHIISSYEDMQMSTLSNSVKSYRPTEFSQSDLNIFYKIIKARTSCRNFRDELISDNIWNDIINIALDAPSGCLRQTARFYIVNNKTTIHSLSKNIAGLSGFSSVIPYLVCVTSDVRAYELKDRFLPYIDTSLCIENFLLASVANNIYTTPLNWQHATVKQNHIVKKILGIPEYEVVILFIAAGYPELIPEKPKRIDLKWIRKL